MAHTSCRGWLMFPLQRESEEGGRRRAPPPSIIHCGGVISSWVIILAPRHVKAHPPVINPPLAVSSICVPGHLQVPLHRARVTGHSVKSHAEDEHVWAGRYGYSRSVWETSINHLKSLEMIQVCLFNYVRKLDLFKPGWQQYQLMVNITRYLIPNIDFW